MLTVEKLKKLVKKDLAEKYIGLLTKSFEKYTIGDLEQIHFITQILHESGGLSRATENMNYSASRLMKIFPKYFPTLEKAQQYERQPAKIGNLVYANRNGNGPVTSGDGYKFRGRGFIQVTFKNNYKALEQWLDLTQSNLIIQPGLVSTLYIVDSAIWYWKSRGLGKYVRPHLDDINDYFKDVKEITYRINGSYRSAKDRFELFKKVHRVLNCD